MADDHYYFPEFIPGHHHLFRPSLRQPASQPAKVRPSVRYRVWGAWVGGEGVEGRVRVLGRLTALAGQMPSTRHRPDTRHLGGCLLHNSISDFPPEPSGIGSEVKRFAFETIILLH
ncbi:hypothetical protein E2C01_072496 [Portunus trituberculatus]|uniref:Uncharacterized protein n=1 Tax=Portunus trituberculatus TaxID=210409 RepID=A0A5B7I6V5_PORTR|nr:hypothetical protein [Portunus trituberculatus]